MLYAFNPCPLEINSNDKLKQEHQESFSSATKSISSLATKLRRVMTYHAGLPPIKSHDPLITVLRDHLTNQNHYNLTTRVTMTTKLGRIVAYLESHMTV